MAFVPFVPPPESPRVRELAERLAEVIKGFDREYPGMSASEIRQALKHALTREGKSKKSVGTRLLGMLAFWIVVISLPLVFYHWIGVSGGDEAAKTPAIVSTSVLLAGVLAAAIAATRSK